MSAVRAHRYDASLETTGHEKRYHKRGTRKGSQRGGRGEGGRKGGRGEEARYKRQPNCIACHTLEIWSVAQNHHPASAPRHRRGQACSHREYLYAKCDSSLGFPLARGFRHGSHIPINGYIREQSPSCRRTSSRKADCNFFTAASTSRF